MPKVLIFTPIYDKKDYALRKFVDNAKNLTYPNFRHIFIDNSKGLDYTRKLKRMGLDVLHVDRAKNTRETLAKAQNLARKIAITDGYDYLFSLESDIFPPLDIVERLMVHTKPVVTGFYLIGNETKVPCITVPEWVEKLSCFGTRLLKPEEIKDYYRNGLQRVAAGGFGACLIRKDIFTKVGFTYDLRFQGHSDIYFFNWCFNHQIPVYVDTHMYCAHDNSDWDKVEDR